MFDNDLKERVEMNRKDFEKFLGKKVQIKIFNGKIIKGELHKTGEEQFKNEPNLYIPRNLYFLINPQSFLFRVSHVRKIVEVKK